MHLMDILSQSVMILNMQSIDLRIIKAKVKLFSVCLFKTRKYKLGFGQGTDFVWSSNNDYAVRDNFTIKIFKNNGN